MFRGFHFFLKECQQYGRSNIFPHRPMYILTFDFTIVGVRHTAEFPLGTVQAVNASNIPFSL